MPIMVGCGTPITMPWGEYPTAGVAVYAVDAGVVNEPAGAPVYVAGVPVNVDPACAVVKGRTAAGAT